MNTANASQQKPLKSSADDTVGHGFFEQLRFLKPYWLSDQKWKTRLQLGGILALTVAEIALTAGVGLGFQAALNALVTKNAIRFAVTGAASLGGIGASALAGNGREYMTQVLGQNWRGWLTGQFSEAWLDGKTYLRLQHNKGYAQNPDQRIAETISNVTGSTLSLGLGLFHAAVSVVTFSFMLWHIAPMMLGAAVVCAVGSYAATHWTGSSLPKIWKRLMDTEAKFRHALGRVRDNAKPIALAGLEPIEKQTLRQEFNSLDANRRELLKVNLRTGVVGWLNMSSASVVPIAMTAPKFFAGTATVGGLELARQVYTQCYFALTWFPQGYSQIASWSANVNQLMDFQKDLEENRADVTGQAPSRRATPAPAAAGPQKQFPASLRPNPPAWITP